MEYEFGELFCPKCNSNSMDIYTNFSSRVVFNGENKIKQYIFYKKIQTNNKCKFLVCDEVSKCFCPGEIENWWCLIIILVFFLIYFALCLWVIDIIYNLCYHKIEECYDYNDGNYNKFVYCSKDENIWEKEKISNKRFTKDFWINNKNEYKNLFKCKKCFYNPNSFLPFIKKNENANLKVLDTETTQKVPDDVSDEKNFLDKLNI